MLFEPELLQGCPTRAPGAEHRAHGPRLAVAKIVARPRHAARLARVPHGDEVARDAAVVEKTGRAATKLLGTLAEGALPGHRLGVYAERRVRRGRVYSGGLLQGVEHGCRTPPCATHTALAPLLALFFFLALLEHRNTFRNTYGNTFRKKKASLPKMANIPYSKEEGGGGGGGGVL